MKRLFFSLFLLFSLGAYAQQDLALTMIDPLDGDSVVSQMTFEFKVTNNGNTTIAGGTTLYIEFVGITGSLTNTSPFSVTATSPIAPGGCDTFAIPVNWNATPPVTFEVCLWLLGTTGDYNLSGGVNYGGIASVLLNDPTPADNEGCQEITIIDNSAPTTITLTPDSIDENLSPGSTVGTLKAIDVDSTDVYTYSLVSGLGSQDNASFFIQGDQLLSTVVFDYETEDLYHCRVLAEDINYGYTYEKVMSIHIRDVFEGNVGIQSLNGPLATLSIQPNPSAEQAMVDLTGFDQDNLTLEVWTLTGQLVRSEKVLANLHPLDRASLSNGTYILRLSSPNGVLAASRWVLTR